MQEEFRQVLLADYLAESKAKREIFFKGMTKKSRDFLGCVETDKDERHSEIRWAMVNGFTIWGEFGNYRVMMKRSLVKRGKLPFQKTTVELEAMYREFVVPGLWAVAHD